MSAATKRWLTLLVAFVLGTLYALLVSFISFKLRAALLSWPVWIVLFAFLLWRFDLLRLTGYLAVLPFSVVTFEVARTLVHPPKYVYQLLTLDRSHYIPRTHVSNPQAKLTDSDTDEPAVGELYIAEDGFRADPATKKGNPTRCRDALIGDSMIYGLGLAYGDTLGPVLEKLNVEACVFGVAGNSPADYLATLTYVRQRLDDDANIAIYVYVYNDFVSMTKYLERITRNFSTSFGRLAELYNYYDDWRRTTFVQSYLRGIMTSPKPPPQPWYVKIGANKVKVHRPHDPTRYQAVGPLNGEQRKTFELFLERLKELKDGRHWRVSIVFIPDNEELFANLATSDSSFHDLDLRRLEALRICRAVLGACADLAPYLFERVVAQGKNPFLSRDRHFSLFGNQIVAQHYIAITRGNESKQSRNEIDRTTQLRNPVWQINGN